MDDLRADRAMVLLGLSYSRQINKNQQDILSIIVTTILVASFSRRLHDQVAELQLKWNASSSALTEYSSQDVSTSRHMLIQQAIHDGQECLSSLQTH
jgi:hypothetical protein